MNTTNKILIIAPCLSMGGMERAAVNTANGLAALGNKVIFLSLFKKEHFFLLETSIEIIEPLRFNENSLNISKSINWIRNQTKLHNPNSILIFSKFYGAIAALALFGTKYKFFISERSSPLFKWNLKIKIVNFVAYRLNPPDGVISQTNIAKQYQQKYFKKKTIIKVIPNTVKMVSLFPNIDREKTILIIGRLGDYLKGFDRLLEAFALIKNKDWKVVIAGGNENGQYLKDLAVQLGILDRINFLGKVKNIDLELAKAGIFVIPSRSEGFPNALVEAMAAGVPCISYNFIAGPQDIIEDDVNGILVPEGDIQGLAYAIDRLILDPAKRAHLGEKALAVREKYKAATIAKEIKQFILSDSN